MHIDIRRCALEIIDICCSYFTYIVGVTRNQVRELCIYLECRRSCGIDPWNLIDSIRQPLHFGLPTTVKTPNSIGKWFGTCVHFRRQRAFTQVHNRSTDYQIFREFVL